MITFFAEQVNADSGLDLAAYLIVGLPGTIAAIFAGVIGWNARKSHRSLAAQNQSTADDVASIRDSTVNDHQRPMRYDVDDVLTEIRAVRVLAEKIGAEVREDRTTRREGDETLRRRLDTLSDRVETIIAKHHPEDSR